MRAVYLFNGFLFLYLKGGENMNKRKAAENNNNTMYGDIKSACVRYSLGFNSIRKLATQCNAVVKVGARTLYNFKKIDAYLDSGSTET